MSKHRIDCYNASSGVVITFAWDDEDEYLRSKAFLEKLVGHVAENHGSSDIEYCYFEDDQQRDAFYAFLRTLKTPTS